MSDFELYEALLWEPERGYFLLDRHMQRLARSAAHFGWNLDVDAVRAALDTHARAAHEPQKVRLMVPRLGPARIEAAPLKPSTAVRAALAVTPIDPDDVFLRHKTSRREVYARALAARPDVDDVILWNTRGELTETCTANLLLELDGEWLTPELRSGLLPGTCREDLLSRGEIREALLMVQDLRRATGLALINSVRKRCPVQLVEP